MEQLVHLINRFQKLKDITGTNKSTSYDVNIRFDVWTDNITITLGTYDVGEWNRYTEIHTTLPKMLDDFEAKIEEAEAEVERWESHCEEEDEQ